MAQVLEFGTLTRLASFVLELVGPCSGDLGRFPVFFCPCGLVLPRAWAARLSSSSLWWASSALAMICSARLTVPLSALVRVDSSDLLPLLFFFFLGGVLPKKPGAGLPAPRCWRGAARGQQSDAVLPAITQETLVLEPRAPLPCNGAAIPATQRHPNLFCFRHLDPEGATDVAPSHELYKW